MMWDGFNKRKFPRLSVKCDIFVESDSIPDPIRTVTENLGVGGVCVVLQEELKRFENCRVKLTLHKGEAAVECFGRVMWVVPTGKSRTKKKVFDTGIEFTVMRPNAAEKIKKYIDRHTTQKKTARTASA